MTDSINPTLRLEVFKADERIGEGDTDTRDVRIQALMQLQAASIEGSEDKSAEQQFSVDYTYGLGEASADDVGVTGTIMIPAGVSERVITLPLVRGDVIDENNERFSLNFSKPRLVSGPSGAGVTGDINIVIVIVDDDTTEVQIADVSVAEDAGTAVLHANTEPA